jgi:hypothetical protein
MCQCNSSLVSQQLEVECKGHAEERIAFEGQERIFRRRHALYPLLAHGFDNFLPLLHIRTGRFVF